MPRGYAHIYCSIWADHDFTSLTPAAKAMYFHLVTQADIEACGVLPLRLRRWAQHMTQGAPAALVPMLNELSDARFIVIDKATEELLVRTFVKWDDGHKHAVRRKAVVASAEGIVSLNLRQVIAGELDKLGVEHQVRTGPNGPGGGVPMPDVESERAALDALGVPPLDRGVSDSTGTGVGQESHLSGTRQGQQSDNSASAVGLESQRSGLSTSVRTPLLTPHSTLRGGVALESDSRPAPQEPPQRQRGCKKHPGGTDEPCGPCKHIRITDEREAAQAPAAAKQADRERRQAERAERAERIAACNLCDTTGHRTTNGQRCNHQPPNIGGRQRALALLAASHATTTENEVAS